MKEKQNIPAVVLTRGYEYKIPAFESGLWSGDYFFVVDVSQTLPSDPICGTRHGGPVLQHASGFVLKSFSGMDFVNRTAGDPNLAVIIDISR